MILKLTYGINYKHFNSEQPHPVEEPFLVLLISVRSILVEN